jgi:hypothetical protein
MEQIIFMLQLILPPDVMHLPARILSTCKAMEVPSLDPLPKESNGFGSILQLSIGWSLDTNNRMHLFAMTYIFFLYLLGGILYCYCCQCCNNQLFCLV